MRSHKCSRVWKGSGAAAGIIVFRFASFQEDHQPWLCHRSLLIECALIATIQSSAVALEVHKSITKRFSLPFSRILEHCTSKLILQCSSILLLAQDEMFRMATNISYGARWSDFFFILLCCCCCCCCCMFARPLLNEAVWEPDTAAWQQPPCACSLVSCHCK
jgi:hypothetical protein